MQKARSDIPTSLAGELQFTFTLDNSYTTSAGAFKPDGTLIRTLWRSVEYKPGVHTTVWDGKDDNGNTVPAGSYQIKVLTHNVNYVWEGVIGNTSASLTGPNVHRTNMVGLAIDGTNGFYSVGYAERMPGMYRFNTGSPQVPTSLPHEEDGGTWNYVATDGAKAYFTHTAPSRDSFVMAWNVADNTEFNFTNGVTVGSNGSEYYWQSVIDRDTDSNQSSGLAVQKNGNVLAVAHGSLNAIRLFDKTNGQLLGSISVTNPHGLAFSANGDLYVLSGTAVVRFTDVGNSNKQNGSLGSFSNPLAIAAHPNDNNQFLVADGGSSQQVKAFDASGNLLWTYGQQGGYATNGPDVTADKFYFDATSGAAAFLAFQPDGSFWVRDTGNDRTLHFSAQRQYLDQIMFLGYDYVVTANVNNPSRVFGRGWLEFAVDYKTKPIQQSWQLVKNWSAGVPSQYFGFFEGLNTVMTLSNNRTYGLIRNQDANHSNQVVELTASGLRLTGIDLDPLTNLFPDGSLQSSSPANGTVTFYHKAQTGFDGSGNPVWSSATTLASAPAGDTDPYYHPYDGDGPHGPQVPLTSDNVVVSFDPGHTGWHLGGVKAGSNQWLWRASPSGPLDGLGTFDPNVWYAGNSAYASGQNIFYGYNGEGWQGGQANQFMQFYDDGLFIGQFGTPHFPYQEPAPGAAGNSYLAAVLKAGGNLYLYHGDEGVNAGIPSLTIPSPMA